MSEWVFGGILGGTRWYALSCFGGIGGNDIATYRTQHCYTQNTALLHTAHSTTIYITLEVRGRDGYKWHSLSEKLADRTYDLEYLIDA